MNKLIALLFILTSTSCSSESTETTIEKQETQKFESTIIEEFPELSDYYGISFSINNPDIKSEENDTPSLSVFMKINKGNHILSPYSSKRYSGRFSITIEDNQKLLMDTTFIETPLSKEEFDPHPFINGLVNRVEVSTNYEHQLTVIGETDFEVTGMVGFTIEPSCTFEEIPFTISYKSGILEVRKKKIKRIITNPKINTY